MEEAPFTCGLDAALFVLGGKWKPLILFHLAHGTRRYGALRRAVGKVSDKVLIQQLKELQADGIISRADHGEIPPRVEYSLTAFGMTLGKVLAPLCEWGTRYSRDVEAILARRNHLGRINPEQSRAILKGALEVTVDAPRFKPRGAEGSRRSG